MEDNKQKRLSEKRTWDATSAGAQAAAAAPPESKKKPTLLSNAEHRPPPPQSKAKKKLPKKKMSVECSAPLVSEINQMTQTFKSMASPRASSPKQVVICHRYTCVLNLHLFRFLSHFRRSHGRILVNQLQKPPLSLAGQVICSSNNNVVSCWNSSCAAQHTQLHNTF